MTTNPLSVLIWELLPGDRLGHTCICTTPKEVCTTWLNTVMSHGGVAWDPTVVWDTAEVFLQSAEQVTYIQPVTGGRGTDNPAVLMMKLGVAATKVEG